MKIGNKLRQWRKENKLTLYDVYEQTGVPTSTISDIENNKKQPTLKTLIPLVRKLNLSLDWLISDKDIIKEINLTEEEKDLLINFRSLSEKEKWKIIGQVEYIADNKK